MTNSYHGDKSTDAFRKFSFSLAIMSLAAVSLIGGLLISNDLKVAHGESLDNASELNAEFFNDDNSDTNQQEVADANSQVTPGRDQDITRGILAQANSETQSNQCDYLTENLRIDMSNDSQQVYRLQAFLQSYAYDYVDLTGQFDEATLRAVQAFQTRHAEDILEPWGYESDEATGYVYITTRQKINEIYCGQDLDLTESQQNEIISYREKLNRWRAQGAEFDTPQYLAQYRGQQNQVAGEQTDDMQDITADSGDDEIAIETNDDSQDSANADNETDSESEEVSGTSVSATGSEETDDSSGFFAQLFGQDNSDDNENADNQATSATNTDNEDGMNTTTTDDESSDESAATSGVDQAATSVYSGVNSFVGFIFSPTFLLILLGVLILLLIATLLEDEEGGDYEEITADDFAKDFEDVDDGGTEDGDEVADEETDNDGTSESSKDKTDSKTKSADFDDTPAGDNGDSSTKDNDSSSSSSSS